MPDTGSAPSQKYLKVRYCTNVKSESSEIRSDETGIEVAVTLFGLQLSEITLEQAIKKIKDNILYFISQDFNLYYQE